MHGLTLEEAYGKWSDELVGYATALVGAHSAPDVVADAFAALLARPADRWNAVSEPRGYLFRCVLNASRMHARSGSRRRRRETAVWSSTTPEEAGSERLLADAGVVAAVRALSVQQRAVVYHTYWDDLPPAAIAALMDISTGSVKRHLARARARLRKELT